MSDLPTPQPARPPSPPPGRRKPGTNKKLANGLIALSTAATIAIYAAGYARTAPASAAASVPAPITIAATATSAPVAAALLAPTATTVPATSTATTAAAAASAATATTTSVAATATTAATATRQATATATTSTAATSSQLKDGTYSGSGTSRHGGIGVAVVIRGGTIVSAEITDCGTRYPCSKIAALPGQVLARQSASVDFVSGATDSSVAYKSAVTAALAQAR